MDTKFIINPTANPFSSRDDAFSSDVSVSWASYAVSGASFPPPPSDAGVCGRRTT